MSNFVNYKIKSNKDKATFYTSSKEQLPGYIPVEVKDRGTFYHKAASNMEGAVERVFIKESKFGDTLDIWFKQESGDIHVLSIPVWRTPTSLNDYLKEFVKLLPNISYGQEVNLWLNNKTKDKSGFLYKNMYAKSGEEKIEWAFTMEEIPRGEKSVNPITKKDQYSFEKNNAFFYEKLQEGITKFDQNNPHKGQSDEQASIFEGVEDITEDVPEEELAF